MILKIKRDRIVIKIKRFSERLIFIAFFSLIFIVIL
nr:MAG TPA: hypothetical protein [Caudoviricetes sp.]